MFFRKYLLVVFRENEGVCRKLHLRGWFLFAALGLVLMLAGGNVYLWRYYSEYNVLESRLLSSDKAVEEQKHQLLSLRGKYKSMEKDLTRIRDFDSKLRVMINLDRDQVETITSMGGPEDRDFSSSYLPVYRQELLVRKMHNFLHQLNTDVRLEEVRQQELMQAIRRNQDLLASTPSIWPTEGWITSRFGHRRSPFTGQREFHKGLDISARIGTPVYAPAKGTVVFTGMDGGYGKAMILNHGAGIVTRYAHMHRVSVKRGQTVTRGEMIGYVGNTGRSTGPHLHYEVRLNGVSVNPERYILN